MTENTIRQNEADAAKSATARAASELEDARTQLLEVASELAELDALLDSDKKLPKDHGGRTREAQSRAEQLSRLVARREAALTEAKQEQARAEAALTEAKLIHLAETVQGFDREEWLGKVVAELQPIIDKHLPDLYRARDAYYRLLDELRADGRYDHPGDPRVGRVNVASGMYQDPQLDGSPLYPVNPEAVIQAAGERLTDSRLEEARAEAIAQATAEMEEREAEAIAERERILEREPFAHWGDARPLKPGERGTLRADGTEATMKPRSAHDMR